MDDPRIEAVAKVFAWAWWKEEPEECHMDLAREAIAAADAAEWQPIETAPRDGTEVLLGAFPDVGYDEDYEPMVVAGWAKRTENPDKGAWVVCGGRALFDDDDFPFWRPKPAGPNREGR